MLGSRHHKADKFSPEIIPITYLLQMCFMSHIMDPFKEPRFCSKIKNKISTRNYNLILKMNPLVLRTTSVLT